MDEWLRGLIGTTAAIILINGLDDLFFDLYYWSWRVYRKTLARRRILPLAEARILEKPEQRVAIMIPAWHEQAVIARMLRNTLGSLEYRNFELFVGTYPNDEPTNHAVAEVEREDPRLHRIVLAHPGPTNKSDCLNHIIAGIRERERAKDLRYDIFMLQDAEDVVDPLSLKLVNYLVPRFSMVQLPVLPFEQPWHRLTAGTYLDEFAQSHSKDLLVREQLSGMVPGAGVGTAFARKAIEDVARHHGGRVFNEATFTEDYDLAFRLRHLEHGSIILQHFIRRGGRPALVATREFFPRRFRDAVRQKARWTLGIVFHGWQQLGWRGGPVLRYTLWRDRKVLLTNFTDLAGYMILLALLGGLLTRGRESPLIPSGSWIWKVLLIDAALLGNRWLQRALSVWRVSTLDQALLSLPRMVWGNVINCAAVIRATGLFVDSQLTGRMPRWNKTAHAFPSDRQLATLRRPPS